MFCSEARPQLVCVSMYDSVRFSTRVNPTTRRSGRPGRIRRRSQRSPARPRSFANSRYNSGLSRPYSRSAASSTDTSGRTPGLPTNAFAAPCRTTWPGSTSCGQGGGLRGARCRCRQDLADRRDRLQDRSRAHDAPGGAAQAGTRTGAATVAPTKDAPAAYSWGGRSKWTSTAGTSHSIRSSKSSEASGSTART